MFKKTILSIICTMLFSFAHNNVQAQSEEGDLNIYGYSQTQAYLFQESDFTVPSNSFNSQQLNVFFQKNLAENWSMFTNIEMINNFSTNLKFGKIRVRGGMGTIKKRPF